MEISTYQPTIRDRVDASLRLCGFNLFTVCPILGINYSTARMTLGADRGGREARRVLGRLANFFEQNRNQELAQDLRSLARLWEKEAA